jgi:hypothetical protein
MQGLPYVSVHIPYHWRDDVERRDDGGLLSLPLLYVIEARQGVRLHILGEE